MTQRLDQSEILTRAARGMGKVDLWGRRGATLVSADEVEAMALALALFGLAPIRPDNLPEPTQPAPAPALAPLMGPADG